MKFGLHKISLILTLLICVTVVCSCQQGKDANGIDARSIIDSSVMVNGGERFSNMDVSFTFRNALIRIKNDKGNYLYSRMFKDSATSDTIVDQLTNSGFTRSRNNVLIELDVEEKEKLSNAVNSIAYFSLLPYKLQEPAVVANYLGDMNIMDRSYQKVKVTFLKEGGGKDYKDEFCYWFNKQTHFIDYLAYTKGGPRFRVATKQHIVNGMHFQDYDNYQFADTTIPVQDYDKIFLQGKMQLLSQINTSNYQAVSN